MPKPLIRRPRPSSQLSGSSSSSILSGGGSWNCRLRRSPTRRLSLRALAPTASHGVSGKSSFPSLSLRSECVRLPMELPWERRLRILRARCARTNSLCAASSEASKRSSSSSPSSEPLQLRFWRCCIMLMSKSGAARAGPRAV
ncbi:hypothetical protein HYQ46_010921 [Verticillium longisporum]|nr:hypothetical protein HYQ46_010921 [Verticillium longisporum]